MPVTAPSTIPMPTMNFKTKGFRELQRQHTRFKLDAKIFRAGIQEAMKIPRKRGRAVYKSVARIRTGALRQSLGTKRPKKLSGGVWYGIYKPRPEFKAIKSVRKKAAKLRLGRPRSPGKVGGNIKPVRYAHLVERGTKHSRAYPFMARTWRVSRKAMERKATAGINAAVEKKLRRMSGEIGGSKGP